MRYAILRLEEEIRAVLDARRHVLDDHTMPSDERSLLLRATIAQLRDLDAAVRILRPYATDGHTTLSPRVLLELRELIGRPPSPKPQPEDSLCAST